MKSENELVRKPGNGAALLRPLDTDATSDRISQVGCRGVLTNNYWLKASSRGADPTFENVPITVRLVIRNRRHLLNDLATNLVLAG